MNKILLVLLFISTISLGQSLRSIGINSYKYIFIEEISGRNNKEARKFLVKNLKKAGYNVVNLKTPKKTYESHPEDLDNNPELALYLSLDVNLSRCYEVSTKLTDYYGNLKFSRSATSCFLLSSAIKNSISSLTSYSYKYKPQ
jgi:hypothetical protein